MIERSITVPVCIRGAGIVPLEAMSAGRPVIALNRGGSLDSMKDGLTGIFFKEQTTSGLSEAISRFEKMKFDGQKIRKHAEEFSVKNFKAKILDFIERKWQNFYSKQI